MQEKEESTNITYNSTFFSYQVFDVSIQLRKYTSTEEVSNTQLLLHPTRHCDPQKQFSQDLHSSDTIGC